MDSDDLDDPRLENGIWISRSEHGDTCVPEQISGLKIEKELARSIIEYVRSGGTDGFGWIAIKNS